jgi:Prenyltransferase and squalene oxidase repeat
MSPVIAALARQQNPDGGFYGMEPDIRLTGSSVIATTIAFQHLRTIGAPAYHPVVKEACRYLRETYDPAQNKWPIIPPTIDNAPHAPWWTLDGELWHSPGNPRAEIAGYLHDYPANFPAEMRTAVVETLLASGDEMEMHDLLCSVRFFETRTLPGGIKTRISDKLSALVARAVERDPAKWGDYGLAPLAIAGAPESPFARLFEVEIPANLDFLIAQQTTDGSWRPNWSWAERHPEGWRAAEHDWRSVLTLANLRTLQAFGR